MAAGMVHGVVVHLDSGQLPHEQEVLSEKQAGQGKRQADSQEPCEGQISGFGFRRRDDSWFDSGYKIWAVIEEVVKREDWRELITFGYQQLGNWWIDTLYYLPYNHVLVRVPLGT
jgi:hypothetical protein